MEVIHGRIAVSIGCVVTHLGQRLTRDGHFRRVSLLSSSPVLLELIQAPLSQAVHMRKVFAAPLLPEECFQATLT